ncbi:MAG: HypC/HybG/HupF family hydrogenase formation chaperone [Nanoarchaeota archaeon]|nr:HypC/HybG/HupF family hydrogenase formation chaperone [DPANN group archaeon]MBL7116240.1 HypC/HybG/HupF family hydrogenase formation chaperone [Nanoarchaeota archaeon]
MRQMKPEQYFLKYSFPCAHTLLEMGSIDEKKFEELRKNTLQNKVMNRAELVILFPAAFRRIAQVAEKMKKDTWDVDVIRKYFLEDHNMYIDSKEGNYEKFSTEFRDFCKVYKGKVVHKEGDILTVEYGHRQRNVLAEILPEAKVGDTIIIHQGFAVEKLE